MLRLLFLSETSNASTKAALGISRKYLRLKYHVFLHFPKTQKRKKWRHN